MSGFSNQGMRQPCKGKPHLALIGGWWRVSAMPFPTFHLSATQLGYWTLAHRAASELNRGRHYAGR